MEKIFSCFLLATVLFNIDSFAAGIVEVEYDDNYTIIDIHESSNSELASCTDTSDEIISLSANAKELQTMLSLLLIDPQNKIFLCKEIKDAQWYITAQRYLSATIKSEMAIAGLLGSATFLSTIGFAAATEKHDYCPQNTTQYKPWCKSIFAPCFDKDTFTCKKLLSETHINHDALNRNIIVTSGLAILSALSCISIKVTQHLYKLCGKRTLDSFDNLKKICEKNKLILEISLNKTDACERKTYKVEMSQDLYNKTYLLRK